MANNKRRSAKGEIVDFDLMKIKQIMGDKPKTVKVEAREEFIERKMRRRLRKAQATDISNKVESDQVAKVEEEVVPVEKEVARPKRQLKKKEDKE